MQKKKMNNNLIKENLQVLVLCKLLIKYHKASGIWLCDVSFDGIIWSDIHHLKRCAINDLNYKLRCLDSLFPRQ